LRLLRGHGERIALFAASFARRTSQQRKHLTSNSPEQRKSFMRDFRDAKAMAQTLREALKTKSISLTYSESLELIAKILGFHDWNVLSANLGARIASERDQAPIRLHADIELPAASLPAGADLPVVPIRDIVLFPQMIVPIFVGREKSKRALGCAMAKDKRFLAVTQRQSGDDDPTPDRLFGVGVIASIIDLTPLNDETIRLMVKSLERVTIARFVEGETLAARLAPFPESRSEAGQADALISNVLERLQAYLNISLSSFPYTRLTHTREPGALADAIAPLMPIDIGERQYLLEIGDATTRLEKILALMKNDRRAT
jgi:Lon protease-like protein